MARIGYIRVSRAGPPAEEQEAALRSAGVEDFRRDSWTSFRDEERQKLKPGEDPWPMRTQLVQALRKGDVVVIQRAARLGTTSADVAATVAAIGAKGASIYDVEAGEAIEIPPAAPAFLAFLARAELQGQQERAAKARGVKARLGKHAGPAKALDRKKMADAKALWDDPALSASDVAKRLNVGVRTLYRHLGPKGTPLFGGKNERKKK